MRNKSIFSAMMLLISILVILLYPPVHAKEVRGVTDDTIKVGIIGDRTGPTADLQLQVIQAIQSYHRHINEKGGVHGRKLDLIIDDCGYAIPRAMAAFKKQVYRDKTFGLLLGSSSGFMRLIAPKCDKEKLVFITSALSESMIPPEGKYSQYSFYGVAGYSDGIRLMFDYIINNLKEKNPKIAYIYPDNEMGKAGLHTCEETAKKYGIALVTQEILSPGALDATTQVLNLKKANANYVIAHTYISPTAALLRDARKLGYDANFIGTSPTCNDDVVQMAKKGAEKFVAVTCFSSWYDDTPGTVNMRNITLKYYPGTEKPYRNRYYTQGWAMSMLFVEGLKRAGKDLTSEGMVSALETIKNFDTGGIAGPITITPNHHDGFKYNRFMKSDVGKGIMLPATGWKKVSD
ncbi:MAG: ABC transporter substrate-binding protein [Thermodesulfobacteriota bacterium]